MDEIESGDKAPKQKPKRYTVWRQNWLESEAGWGIRPDGCSLHLTKRDLEAYLEKYWDRMPMTAPREYSRPSGDPCRTRVSQERYDEIRASENGCRYWRHEDD